MNDSGSYLRFLGAITTGCMRPFVPRTNKNEITTIPAIKLVYPTTAKRGAEHGAADATKVILSAQSIVKIQTTTAAT